ncbi:MAG: GtrA-like protein [Bacteroidetes bacterium ADurb.BinA395]|nr:MAG: GtrA-like protein [Bacteroidetes bacterium ADurb.BinA395]
MSEIKKKKKQKLLDNLMERLKTFTKAQFSAMTGGAVDYMVMVFFTEVFHIHYTISIAIGGIVGAVVNFTLNKSWTFKSKELPYKSTGIHQLLKFALVVTNSIVLKSSSTYLITTILVIDYKFSRIITDLIISIGFNYNLQKHWVFRKIRVSENNDNLTDNKLPLADKKYELPK